MSNITTFSAANLPSVTSLSTALRALETEVGAAGVVILKMDKTGHWVFGADQTEVDDSSTWAVNPFSFVHGFIAWGDGEVLGEKMVSVSQPLPELEEAPPMARKGWETQVGMSMKCLSGEDKGMEVRYTTTSVGGKRSVQALAVAIATQVDTDPKLPVPIVNLEKEHYSHKSYGRIYTPIFKIASWMSMTDEPSKAPKDSITDDAPEVLWPAPEVESAAPVATARRRRS
jgi:hypothetical protein